LGLGDGGDSTRTRGSPRRSEWRERDAFAPSCSAASTLSYEPIESASPASIAAWPTKTPPWPKSASTVSGDTPRLRATVSTNTLASASSVAWSCGATVVLLGIEALLRALRRDDVERHLLAVRLAHGGGDADRSEDRRRCDHDRVGGAREPVRRRCAELRHVRGDRLLPRASYTICASSALPFTSPPGLSIDSTIALTRGSSSADWKSRATSSYAVAPLMRVKKTRSGTSARRRGSSRRHRAPSPRTCS
jgi:hypothetical protein